MMPTKEVREYEAMIRDIPRVTDEEEAMLVALQSVFTAEPSV